MKKVAFTGNSNQLNQRYAHLYEIWWITVLNEYIETHKYSYLSELIGFSERFARKKNCLTNVNVQFPPKQNQICWQCLSHVLVCVLAPTETMSELSYFTAANDVSQRRAFSNVFFLIPWIERNQTKSSLYFINEKLSDTFWYIHSWLTTIHKEKNKRHSNTDTQFTHKHNYINTFIAKVYDSMVI